MADRMSEGLVGPATETFGYMGFGLASIRNEGQAVEFDPGAAKPSAEELAALRAAQEAELATYTPFAMKWAAILIAGEDSVEYLTGAGFGERYYEAPHFSLVEDLMRVEAALRAEITAGG